MNNLPKREFLQQAHSYSEDIDISGFYASEKLDGIRAFWDGGITRGMLCKEIPYASKVIVKSGKPKPHLDKPATGLWSRYGNPIYAPDYFLNQLPSCMLDGELWMGRGNFQTVSKVVRKKTPDERWRNVEYKIFGSPSPSQMFRTGHCRDGKNIDLILKQEEIKSWLLDIDIRNDNFNMEDWKCVEGNFVAELFFLEQYLAPSEGPASIHQQIKLADDPVLAARNLDEMMEKALSNGAEGLVVRDSNVPWTPKRVKYVLKVVPCHDDEAVITGFLTGEETDRGSKLLGKIGSIILDWNGIEFKIAGLTDEEREFKNEDMVRWAKENPRTECPLHVWGAHFTIGETVTFKYKELTDDGVPKNPRYSRKRDEE